MADWAICVITGDANLAASNTDGKGVHIKNKSLDKKERQAAINEAMKELGGPSNCAVGGGVMTLDKYKNQTGTSPPGAGAGPSKRNRTAANGGSAPSA